LEELDRLDLAKLLEHATYEIDIEIQPWGSENVTLVLRAPDPFDEALAGLSEQDKKRIVEAIKKADDDAASRLYSDDYGTARDRDRVLSPAERLLAEVVAEMNMMLRVAMGKRIPDVDDHYRARHKRLNGVLTSAGIPYENQFASLWDWYHSDKWESGQGSWSARCRFVRGLLKPTVEALCATKVEPVPAREPTGWERVDRAVRKAREDLGQARHEEDFQAVGLLCREAIISLAQGVFDPTVHESLDGKKPSDTDAKRMLEAYLSKDYSGSSNEELRRHAKASFDLALALQHRRTANFRSAALCLEATSSVVNVIAIIAGRRDP
jgi:hypothetical protein